MCFFSSSVRKLKECVCVCVCVCVSQSVSKTHSPQTMIEQLKDRLR